MTTFIRTMPDGTTLMLPRHDTHIAKWVVENGMLDHDQWLLPQLLPYLGNVVWDVGAYIGDHTVFYARHAQEVIAFEPNPLSYECLCYNMVPYSWVTCVNMALSDRNSAVGIIADANLGASYITEHIEAIPSMPADSTAFPSPSFIKIDAEGFEPRILEGAAKTIALSRPHMLIEVNRGTLARYGAAPEDIYAKLIAYNYTFRNINEAEGLDHDQFDILCTPRTH